MTDPTPSVPHTATARLRTAWRGLAHRGVGWTSGQLLLAASVFWMLAFNGGFFVASLRDRSLAAPATWGFAAALAVMLVALHVLMLGLFAHRRSVKPLVGLMTVVAAAGSYFVQRYGVYLDPDMLRNTLRTDVPEARELLSWSLAWHLLLFAALPLALLSRVRVVGQPLGRAIARRAALMLVAFVALAGAIWSQFQPLASLMRNHKEVRYLITPANTVWSTGVVLAQQAQGAAQPRQPIGLDAAPGPSWAAATKPRVIVLVVGETARAANWGLNGYARATTPELAALPVINFRDVTSCGTNTETSLPCMFAPVGRRDYDEARIRGSESLLQVVQRAGVQVFWRDNQSGCKGVCDGVPNDSVETLNPPGLCGGGRCLDEGLLAGLDERLARAKGTQLLVLHMLGNHGPSYYARYPEAFAKFQPACKSDDLRLCSRDEIVNAYDNALLYTDHVLARLVRTLTAHAASVDSAMVFVSDHGESLGENGLFLHGLPYAIAPDVQKHVPMTWWLSPGFVAARHLDSACLAREATHPASHDHLFHTLLALVDVRTALYEPRWDLTAACRGR